MLGKVEAERKEEAEKQEWKIPDRPRRWAAGGRPATTKRERRERVKSEKIDICETLVSCDKPRSTNPPPAPSPNHLFARENWNSVCVCRHRKKGTRRQEGIGKSVRERESAIRGGWSASSRFPDTFLFLAATPLRVDTRSKANCVVA